MVETGAGHRRTPAVSVIGDATADRTSIRQAPDMHAATESIASLLDLDDPTAVMVRLLSFPLFGLPRAGRAGWARKLQTLREEP